MRNEVTTGSWWTRDRAADAVRRMTQHFDEGEDIRQFIAMLDNDMVAGRPSTLLEGLPPRSTAPLDASALVLRRATPEDVPQLGALILSGDLPPLFIGEFLEGFIVADHDGEIVACGGLELYDDCGMIRSVVVDERLRGGGVGRAIARLLEDDARAYGARVVYLFTEHALPFWKRLGYDEIADEEWEDAPRAGWQYRFVIPRRAIFGEGVHGMRRAL